MVEWKGTILTSTAVGEKMWGVGGGEKVIESKISTTVGRYNSLKAIFVQVYHLWELVRECVLEAHTHIQRMCLCLRVWMCFLRVYLYLCACWFVGEWMHGCMDERLRGRDSQWTAWLKSVGEFTFHILYDIQEVYTFYFRVEKMHTK